ncbi:MAG TPA: hypothetical protein VF771_16915 [Longimicrobiaceae bacterium]
MITTRSLNCLATAAVLFLFACTDDRQPLGPDAADLARSPRNAAEAAADANANGYICKLGSDVADDVVPLACDEGGWYLTVVPAAFRTHNP